MLNEKYWTEKYQANTTGWDIGYASPPLLQYALTYPKETKILIPGAGNGHEALELAALGYTNVTVCDLSKIPLHTISEKDKTKSIHLIEGDFFGLQDTYDLILEQTFFCALDPNLRAKYVQQMHHLLAENGKLAGVLFNIEFEKEGPPFGGTLSQYQLLFKGILNIIKMEECYNSIPQRQGNELFFIVEK